MSLEYKRFAHHIATVGYNIECVYVLRTAMNKIRLIELIHLQTSVRILLDMLSAEMLIDNSVDKSLVAVLIRVPSATIKSMVDETTGDPKGSPRGLDTLRMSVTHDALVIPDNVQSCAYLGSFAVALNDMVGNANATMSMYVRNNVAVALALPIPGKSDQELAIARFVIEWGSDIVPDLSSVYCGVFADVKWFYNSIGTFGTLASALLDATLDAMCVELRAHVQCCIQNYQALLPFMKYLETGGWPMLTQLRASRMRLAQLIANENATAHESANAIATMDRLRVREHALVFTLEELVRSTPVCMRAPKFAANFSDVVKLKID